MNKLIRYWNQNRVKIILVVAVIAFLIIVIQLLNQVARENNKANNTKKENVVEGLPTESIINVVEKVCQKLDKLFQQKKQKSM